ncbi:MAG: DUF4269 domain-containing protein [Bacteroidales bacterium]|nr:DUF4269 domain-containing protein [Bacteroidales bacterium]
MNFDSIDYLQHGNSRQQHAYAILTNNRIIAKLNQFDPILAGTIPLHIDIENSDLDIICCFQDKQEFQKTITNNFSEEKSFTIKEKTTSGLEAIIATFVVDDFKIEIFGQNIPTKQQLAYRHLVIEHRLLNKHGDTFRQQIIELKRQGYKTEPAFAIALNLTGDPYTELLKLDTNDYYPNR